MNSLDARSPILRFFSEFIQNELGIVYSRENFFQLSKRLDEICRQLGFKDQDELYKRAQSGIQGHLRQLLLDVATNNETSFFRDAKLFTALADEVLPLMVQRFPKQPVLRIWCAASSFGQEPYTLAIILNEWSKRQTGLPRFEILATDISQTALKRAREGRYSQLEVQRGLPAIYLTKYFTKGQDDYWTLKPEIRVSVQFREQNLLSPLAALGQFELILCRNVLIYQTDAKKKEILFEIAKRLLPGGYLVMGAAESLLGLSDAFQQQMKKGAIVFERKAA